VAENIKKDLLNILLAALREVNGRRAVLRYFQPGHRVAPAIVAIGKAAQAMILGAYDAFGQKPINQGLVITKQGHLDELILEKIGCKGLEAGHPIPDAQSLAAGSALLEFISRQPADRPILFLISGGTSSLVEVLPEGISLDVLIRVNDWLLASGLPVKHINSVRRKLSKIKGGGLLQFVDSRSVEVLLISDVQDDDVAVIGSGLLAAPPDSTVCDELKEQALPGWIQALITRSGISQPVSPVDVSLQIVANLDMACKAAVKKAEELGYSVVRHNEFLCGGAEVAGRHLAKELMEGAAGIHVWGGETTVQLPINPGRGGRNQHLALSAAQEIAGHEGLYLLAVGTDGTDGVTDDAGALVDGGTIERAFIEGYDSGDCLRRADAGSLLAASGDLINIGSTGTNVMDVVIGFKLE